MTVAAQLRMKGRPAPVARHRITPRVDGGICDTCGRCVDAVQFEVSSSGDGLWKRTVRFLRHVGPKS